MTNTPKTAGIPQHASLRKTRFQLIAVAKIDRHTIRNSTYDLEQVGHDIFIIIILDINTGVSRMNYC